MKKFQRKKENFICMNCKTFVEGDGYTNHCPECLWSKHVDINPGDRLSDCCGMMKPIKIVNKGDVFSVIQKCEKCGHERKNKLVKGDSFKTVCEIFSKI